MWRKQRQDNERTEKNVEKMEDDHRYGDEGDVAGPLAAWRECAHIPLDFAPYNF